MAQKTLAFFLAVSILTGSFGTPARAQGYTLVTEVGGALGAAVESALANTESAVANTSTAASSGLQATIMNVLNGIAWDVAKMAIQAMTNSIVNWINSGFQGSPAFETDLQQGLSQLADLKARQFFDELSTSNNINSPFLEDVAFAVGAAYYVNSNQDRLQQRLRYTLNQFTTDDRAFLQGDFAQGGFDGWFAAWMNPQNNPIGASFIAGGELSSRIEDAAFARLQELAWGRGFLSWRGDCLMSSGNSQGGAANLGESGRETCAQYDIVTPGSFIEGQLGITASSPLRQLELADSINEIVAALMVQLVTQALGGNGLSGLSQPSSGGGSSAVDRATSGNGDESGSLTRGLESKLSGHKRDMEKYKSNWSKVGTAAASAQTTLNTRSCPKEEELQTRVTSTATQATEAGTAADRSLAEIQKVVDMLPAQNTQNRAAALSAASNAYIGLLSSGVLVSDNLVTRSDREAADTGTTRPGSLFSQMTRIATDCDVDR